MKHPLHTKPSLGTYLPDTCHIEVNDAGQKRHCEHFAEEWMDGAAFDAKWLSFETRRKESLGVDLSDQVAAAVAIAEEEIAKIQNS